MILTTDPLSIIETGVFDRKPVSQWGDGQRITLLGVLPIRFVHPWVSEQRSLYKMQSLLLKCLMQ